MEETTTYERRTMSDTRATFADALNRAEAGSPVIITRYGDPCAALVSMEQSGALEELTEIMGENGTVTLEDLHQSIAQ